MSPNFRGGRLMQAMPLRPVHGVTMREVDVENTVVVIEASGFTLNARTEVVQIQCLGEAMRYTLDGSDPTPTHGFKFYVGASLELFVQDAKRFKCIREDAAASSAARLICGEFKF
jgi:hypothetical protein